MGRDDVSPGATTSLDHPGCGVAIDAAVAWFIENELTCPRPIIPQLRKMFDLSAVDACAVLREAALSSAQAGHGRRGMKWHRPGAA